MYTEKVIKKARINNGINEKKRYGLAHMQCQLAVVSLFILGIYAMIMDSKAIREKVSPWTYIFSTVLILFASFLLILLSHILNFYLFSNLSSHYYFSFVFSMKKNSIEIAQHAIEIIGPLSKL